jgi:predicted RNA-binding Zn-ribbon protein involved in translation (DUF1610 family)
MEYKEEDKKFYETAKHDSWKPCIMCGGELIQLRKAFFKCINCGQEYIADDMDMVTNTL